MSGRKQLHRIRQLWLHRPVPQLASIKPNNCARTHSPKLSSEDGEKKSAVVGTEAAETGTVYTKKTYIQKLALWTSRKGLNTMFCCYGYYDAGPD
ncbi:Major facilitator superfamily domain general substrate transporter [Penicillium vulpinum]|uniref:Major facilitator superfamily domain general substrate transporter n=1 Tax=Penicillium vulpinum TaxID=29845 RepID=UPI002547A0B7|nr:Major facilitator superfamily domain general substrate transporter [Penicillium vulpinum]KAJ5971173.1 Major facilitator superfamily domain general substrate transporter [Penicillium vulpinum]